MKMLFAMALLISSLGAQAITVDELSQVLSSPRVLNLIGNDEIESVNFLRVNKSGEMEISVMATDNSSSSVVLINRYIIYAKKSGKKIVVIVSAQRG